MMTVFTKSDKSATIQEILRFCLKESNLSYQIKGKMIVIKEKSEITATNKEAIKFGGRIIDDHGQPVAGVSIIGVGTSRGSVSSPNGEFLILLPKEHNLDLRFSFIGLVTREMTVIKDGKVIVRDPLNLSVKMETDVNQIDDVVVTGIVNLSKKSFTSSSTTVSREEMKKVSPTNILKAVQVFAPSFRMVDNSIIPEFRIKKESKHYNNSGEFRIFIVDNQ